MAGFAFEEKDGIVDSRIREKLPQNWTIEAF